MSEKSQSIFEKQISPFLQAAVVVALVLIVIAISKLISILGIHTSRTSFPWEIAFSGLLFFAIFNCIFSFAQTDQNSYWGKSVIAFVVLGATSMGLAWLISGQDIDQAGSFRWMAILFTFSYLLMLTIARSMRKIIKIAQKQDARLRGEEETNNT